MTQIDFLPQRYRDQSVLDRAKLWHLAIVSVLGGLMALAAIFQFGTRQRVLADLSEVQAESNAAQAKIKRVAELQLTAKSESADAELLTWLRHPWPRTQLLGAIAEHLPPEVTLDELRLEQDEVRGGSPAAAPETNTAAAGAAPKLSPPALDLTKLRAVHDNKLSLVVLGGETSDTAALHAFLAQIGSVGLYSKVELISIESGAGAEKQSATRFKARLTVRRGFGQAGGPQAAWRVPLPDGSPLVVQAKSSAEVQP